MVLLKGADERGFVFYTGYESRKGGELTENPRAALLFHWEPLGRQVRIEGAVVRTEDVESDAYFATRPVPSRLSAWASTQSEVIADREALQAKVEEARLRFGAEVPRPPAWGGFRLTPSSFEFWEHREDRLHDRFRYLRTPNGSWLIERLAP
jgi:pyridoxamine 5'-phosphate oxidase